jgi:hypothetical protein
MSLEPMGFPAPIRQKDYDNEWLNQSEAEMQREEAAIEKAKIAELPKWAQPPTPVPEDADIPDWVKQGMARDEESARVIAARHAQDAYFEVSKKAVPLGRDANKMWESPETAESFEEAFARAAAEVKKYNPDESNEKILSDFEKTIQVTDKLRRNPFSLKKQDLADLASLYAENVKPKERGTLGKMTEAAMRSAEGIGGNVAKTANMLVQGPEISNQESSVYSQLGAMRQDAVRQADPVVGSGTIEQGLIDTAEQIPMIAGQVLMAAASGPAAPLTVPLMWASQIAPGEYENLKENGVSDKYAVPLSLFSGLIQGEIEQSQVGAFLPKAGAVKELKTIMSLPIKQALLAVGKKAEKFGLDLTEQMLEETLQSASTLSTLAVGTKLSGTYGNVDWDKQFADQADQLKRALVSIPMMMVGGKVLSLAGGHKSAPKTRATTILEYSRSNNSEKLDKELASFVLESPLNASAIMSEENPSRTLFSMNGLDEKFSAEQRKDIAKRVSTIVEQFRKIDEQEKVNQEGVSIDRERRLYAPAMKQFEEVQKPVAQEAIPVVPEQAPIEQVQEQPITAEPTAEGTVIPSVQEAQGQVQVAPEAAAVPSVQAVRESPVAEPAPAAPAKVEAVSPMPEPTAPLNETSKVPPSSESQQLLVESPKPAAEETKLKSGVGARKSTKEGQKRVEDAQQRLREIINNPDIVGKQRADMISNGRNLIGFLQAKANQNLEEGYEHGDRVAYTGEDAPEGMRTFMFLEGARAGSEGVAPTASATKERVEKQKAEYKDQQESFARLRDEPQSIATEENKAKVETLNQRLHSLAKNETEKEVAQDMSLAHLEGLSEGVNTFDEMSKQDDSYLRKALKNGARSIQRIEARRAEILNKRREANRNRIEHEIYGFHEDMDKKIQRQSEESREAEFMGSMGGGAMAPRAPLREDVVGGTTQKQTGNKAIESIPGLEAPNENIARHLNNSMNGISKEGLLNWFKKWAIKLKNQFRERQYLPNIVRFDSARDIIRQFEATPQAMHDETQRVIAAYVDPLGKKQLALFNLKTGIDNLATAVQAGDLNAQKLGIDQFKNKKEFLADFEKKLAEQGIKKGNKDYNKQLNSASLMWDNAQSVQNQPRRFGFESTQQILDFKQKIDELVAKTPEVQVALKRRAEGNKALVKDLVANELLPESALENVENYIHQQILLKHNEAQSVGSIGGMNRKQRGFQQSRVAGKDLQELGEEYNYNLNFVESEYTWQSEARIELKKKQLRDELIKIYDTMPERMKEAEAKGVSVSELLKEGEVIHVDAPDSVWRNNLHLSDRIENAAIEAVAKQFNLDPKDVEVAMSFSGQTVVFPKELSEQLKSMKRPEDSVLKSVIQTTMKIQKIALLLSPQRVIGYMLRNMTGDFEAVTMGEPLIAKKIKQSTDELYKYYYGKRIAVSDQLKQARDLGVMDSGMIPSEVPDIKSLPLLNRLFSDPEWYKQPGAFDYFGHAKKASTFREAIARYAAYLHFKEMLDSGKPLRNFASSRQSAIEAIAKERGNAYAAAKLARELLGDYGATTEIGKFLSANLIPFWRFQGINLKRTPRTFINAFKIWGNTRGNAGAKAAYTALALSRLVSFQAAITIWNHMFRPDEEEKLGPYERQNPHFNIGTKEDGSIMVFRNIGVMGDFFEWFGMNTALNLAPKYLNGQLTMGDIWDEAKWDAVKKVAGAARMDVKGGVEVLTGQSYFPDPFNPRKADRGELAASALALREEYKMLHGLLTGSGKTARKNYFERYLYGIINPKDEALNEIYSLRDSFLKKKGEESPNPTGIPAIKEMKEAFKNDNYEAFLDARKVYLSQKGRGYKSFESAISRLDPMHKPLGKLDEGESKIDREDEFYQYLTAEQRGKLRVARDYALEMEGKLYDWWKRAEKEEPQRLERMKAIANKAEYLIRGVPAMKSKRAEWEKGVKEAQDWFKTRGIDFQTALDAWAEAKPQSMSSEKIEKLQKRLK